MAHGVFELVAYPIVKGYVQKCYRKKWATLVIVRLRSEKWATLVIARSRHVKIWASPTITRLRREKYGLAQLTIN